MHCFARTEKNVGKRFTLRTYILIEFSSPLTLVPSFTGLFIYLSKPLAALSSCRELNKSYSRVLFNIAPSRPYESNREFREIHRSTELSFKVQSLEFLPQVLFKKYVSRRARRRPRTIGRTMGCFHCVSTGFYLSSTLLQDEVRTSRRSIPVPKSWKYQWAPGRIELKYARRGKQHRRRWWNVSVSWLSNSVIGLYRVATERLNDIKQK